MFHRSSSFTDPRSVTDHTASGEPEHAAQESGHRAGSSAAEAGVHGNGCCGKHEHAESKGDPRKRDSQREAA